MQQQLSWQFHKISFILEKTADEALKRHLDLGFAQYKVLEAINHNTLARQNTVAAMLDQTEASVSRQVRILEKKGLINISSVMGNKRARELSLTKVGEEMTRNAVETIEISQAKYFANISFAEQQKMLELFSRMIDNSKDN